MVADTKLLTGPRISIQAVAFGNPQRCIVRDYSDLMPWERKKWLDVPVGARFFIETLW